MEYSSYLGVMNQGEAFERQSLDTLQVPRSPTLFL
jgi:hypothetical protein